MPHHLLPSLQGKRLSPMQEATCEALLAGKSVTLLAPTGSGKTLAFLVPLAALLRDHDGGTAIVVCPTRELTRQSLDVWRGLHTGIPALCLHGGRPVAAELPALQAETVRLIFATPGRLLDHLERGCPEPAGVRRIVIDEFDKCLELGFRDEMGRIARLLSGVGQTVLVSATDSPELPAFIQGRHGTSCIVDYLPKESDTPRPGRITQNIVRCGAAEKPEALMHLLNRIGGEASIVFVTTRDDTENVAAGLRKHGFAATLCHGGQEEAQRERNMFRFRSHCANVLVTTNLASRGLDLPEVRHVIHFHLPDNGNDYEHRTGRTARWDSCGTTWLMLETGQQLPDFVADATEVQLAPGLPRPVVPPWCALYIGRGKKAKLSRGDIAGYLCKAGGAASDDIGRIEVMPTASYAALKREAVARVLENAAGKKIKGQRTLVERMRE